MIGQDLPTSFWPMWSLSVQIGQERPAVIPNNLLAADSRDLISYLAFARQLIPVLLRFFRCQPQPRHHTIIATTVADCQACFFGGDIPRRLAANELLMPGTKPQHQHNAVLWMTHLATYSTPFTMYLLTCSRSRCQCKVRHEAKQRQCSCSVAKLCS